MIRPVKMTCIALTAISLSSFASAAPAVVLDPSFESIEREPAAVPFAPRRWNLVTGGGAVGRSILDPALPGQEGPHVGFIELDLDGGYAAWFQDVTIMEEGSYSATVALATQQGREPVDRPFKINFEAVGMGQGTQLLGTNEFPIGAASSSQFTDVTADFVLPAGDPAIGRYLRMVLVMDGGAESGVDSLNPGGRYLLDDVRLNFTPTGGISEEIFVGESSMQPEAWYRTYSDNNSAGQYRPLAPLFPNQSGDQLGFATMSPGGGHAGVYQDGPVIEAGTYTLTAAVGGDAVNTPSTSQFVMKFEAINPGFDYVGGETFTPADISTTALTDLSTTVTIPVGSPLIGRQLRSVLVAENADNNATYYIDDVRLDFVPIPEPTGVFLACIGAVVACCRRRWS